MATTAHSAVISAETARLGDVFTANRLDEASFGGLIDPVLMLDHFRITGRTFEAHPHAGFSAVTYLLQDSQVGLMNVDSLGTQIAIQPGDLHWTVAGSGVVHNEPPLMEGREVHGLQIFVNLPAQKKFMAPQAIHLHSADIPEYSAKGVRVRVVAGATQGIRSPVALPEPFTLLDGLLAADSNFNHTLPAGWQALLYLVSGKLALNTDAGQHRLQAGQALGISAAQHNELLNLQTENGAHFIILSGQPLQEPIVKHGPFVMNNREQISQVIRAYTDGKMGRLPVPSGNISN
jgi:redox-sensitive bicupin YhaK (pirin superfamily)